MASRNVEVEIDTTDFLRRLGATVNGITLERLSVILRLTPDETLDWLVAKVAQFRGISESEAKALIEDTDRAV